MLTNEQLAARAAREVPPRARVLLGAGLSGQLLPHLHHACVISPADGAAADVALLRARQVSATGDLAACGLDTTDLAILTSARRVIALLPHLDQHGEPTLLHTCTLPVSARQAVTRIVTDLAVLDVTATGLRLVELAPGARIEDLLRSTRSKVALIEPDRS